MLRYTTRMSSVLMQQYLFVVFRFFQCCRHRCNLNQRLSTIRNEKHAALEAALLQQIDMHFSNIARKAVDFISVKNDSMQ